MMAQEPATTDKLNYSHRLVAGAFQEILLGSKPGCAALLLTHRGETAARPRLVPLGLLQALETAQNL